MGKDSFEPAAIKKFQKLFAFTITLALNDSSSKTLRQKTVAIFHMHFLKGIMLVIKSFW